MLKWHYISGRMVIENIQTAVQFINQIHLEQIY